jgi:hypothetical protein
VEERVAIPHGDDQFAGRAVGQEQSHAPARQGRLEPVELRTGERDPDEVRRAPLGAGDGEPPEGRGLAPDPRLDVGGHRPHRIDAMVD